MAEPRALDRRASSEARRCVGRRVHLISITSTCSIGGVSERDGRLTSRHVAFREAPECYQIEGLKINRGSRSNGYDEIRWRKRHVDSPRRDDGDQTVDKQRSLHHAIEAHDQSSRSMIARSKLTIARSWLTIATSRRCVDFPISIGRLSLYEIVNRVVGHDPCGFASSDSVNFIAERTAHIAREISFIKSVVFLFSIQLLIDS